MSRKTTDYRFTRFQKTISTFDWDLFKINVEKRKQTVIGYCSELFPPVDEGENKDVIFCESEKILRNEVIRHNLQMKISNDDIILFR